MYRMVKARKLKALSGVKICASAALSWASVVEPVEDGQGADHRFLGSEAGDEGGGGAPVVEAKRRKDRCNHRADRGQDAVALSATILRRQSKLCKNQMTIEAMKMMVKALV